MKFSILNLMFLVTIVALIVALVVVSKTKVVTISVGHYDSWDVPESIANDSLWEDKTISPRFSISDAYSISDDIAERLNEHESNDMSNWRIARISLEHLDLYSADSWGYIVSVEGSKMLGWNDSRGGMALVSNVSLLVLMDGSVYFDHENTSVGYAKLEFYLADVVTHPSDTPEISVRPDVNPFSGRLDVDPFGQRGVNPFGSSDSGNTADYSDQ